MEIAIVVGLIGLAILVAVIVLSKKLGVFSQKVRQKNKDAKMMRRVQRETNKPVPTDPDDVDKLLRDS